VNIQERLAIFYERLRLAPAQRTAEHALAFICSTLEAVEDEFSAIAKKSPSPQLFDGRMYPPEPDYIQKRASGAMWIKTRHHRIEIKATGGFAIYREMPHRTLVLECGKEGAAL
jgi:hypothetical protein